MVNELTGILLLNWALHGQHAFTVYRRVGSRPDQAGGEVHFHRRILFHEARKLETEIQDQRRAGSYRYEAGAKPTRAICTSSPDSGALDRACRSV